MTALRSLTGTALKDSFRRSMWVNVDERAGEHGRACLDTGVIARVRPAWYMLPRAGSRQTARPAALEPHIRARNAPGLPRTGPP